MRGYNFSGSARANRGFALLIAIILASVAAAIGVALASLAYKDVRISEVGQTSQYAFYSADTALECALYADQQQDAFDYVTHAPTPTMQCVSGTTNETISFAVTNFSANTLQFLSQSPSGYSNGWFPIDGSCARITAYKATVGTSTYIYAEGLSACNTSDPRTLERGLSTHY